MRITSVFLVRWPVLLCHCKKSPNKHSILAPGTATAWLLGLQERTFLSSTSCTLADQGEPSRFTARCAPGADITVPKTQFRAINVLDVPWFRGGKQSQTWEWAEPPAAQLSSGDALPAHPWLPTFWGLHVQRHLTHTCGIHTAHPPTSGMGSPGNTLHTFCCLQYYVWL